MSAFRRWAGFLAMAAAGLAMAASSACSRRSEPVIVVQIVAGPGTLTAGRPATLIAAVSNDTSGAGVDWTCSGAACGTFAPAHTASGAATIFTAAAAPGAARVTATSTADGAIRASLDITVVPAGSNAQLIGTYVFAVQGEDGSGSYAAAGTIVADGDGHIIAGQQDYVDEAFEAGPDPLTGSYAIGPDGRGSLMLDVDNANLPLDGTETFGIALVSPAHALITQLDGTAASSGSLDRQSPDALEAAAITGAFAFTVQGAHNTTGAPIAQAGVLIMDAAAGTISGGTLYENDGGLRSSAATTGAVTAPDPFGRGRLSFSAGINFVYYAVRGRVLRLLTADFPTLTTAGAMFSQGDAGSTGSFSNASFAGDHVLSASGGTSFGPLALAGQFAADGAGSFTSGVADVNDAGAAAFSSIAGQARYTIGGNGVGTVDLPPAADPRGAVSSLLVFAVDPSIDLFDPNGALGNGGALVMVNDASAVGTGSIVRRSAGVFDGPYALSLAFVDASGENDWIGAAAAAAGAWTGTVDVNNVGLVSAGLGLTGAYAADAVNAGRWTGTLTAAGDTHSIRFYQVSDALLVLVDVDQADIGIGTMGKD